MEEMEFDSVRQRKHKRFFFEPGKRPVLKINKDEFEVEDISESGLKFIVDKEVKLTRNLKGTVTFFEGDTIDIDGHIVWASGDAVGVELTQLIPLDLLETNQEKSYLTTKITIPQFVATTSVESGYSLKNLSKLDIDQKNLKMWSLQGFIEPSIKQEGAQNLFSRFDLYLVKLFEQLVTEGISEEEAAVRIKIIKRAEKKSGAALYKKPFVAFKKKLDFSMIPEDLKEKLVQLLSGDLKPEEDEKEKLTKMLKLLSPQVVDETEKEDLLASDSGKDSLVVNFKEIRDYVDNTIE